MNIGLTNIQIKNPLQHNNTKPHGLNEKLDLIQEQKIQHKSVAKHNTQIGEKMQKNVNKKSDEGEQNGKKKKKN